jgi:hypothetical protein
LVRADHEEQRGASARVRAGILFARQCERIPALTPN